MATATAKRRKHFTRIQLREDIHRGKPERVDRENGIIYGVRVCGNVSENGRRYLQEALIAAIPLYEGRSVRIDHPAKPQDNRPVTSIFGKLVNVREDKERGGLQADLHFVKSHDLAEFVCEVAERMSDQLGLSHNAEGDGVDRDGTFIVNKIHEIRSVDIVADPATTKGLFESRQPMNFKESLQKLAKKDKNLAKWLKEEGEAMLDMPGMEEPVPDEAGDDPAEALKAGFRAAIDAILDDETMDAASKVAKIKEYLHAHEKLAGGESPEPAAELEEEEDEEKKDEPVKEECDDKEKEKLVKESLDLKAKNKALENKLKVRDLCEAKGVKPLPAVLAALERADTDKERAELIEAIHVTGKTSTPRTASPNARPETGGADYKSWLETIKN